MKRYYFVYIINSKERRRYIGFTTDWKRRIKEHNNEIAHNPQWTERFSKWQVIYLKRFDNYTEARKWEIHLKKQKGGAGLRHLIETTNEYSGVEQSGSSAGS